MIEPLTALIILSPLCGPAILWLALKGLERMVIKMQSTL